MTISGRTALTISPDVLHQELDGQTVLLDSRSEHYLGLNGVGTHIWRLIGEKRTVDDLIGQMLTEYDVDEKTLRRDLDALIQQLLDRGLIEIDKQG